MAIQILIHTFRMIFGNIGQALRVSVGPNLILLVFTFFAFGSLGLGSFDTMGAEGVLETSAFAALMSLLLLPLSVFVIAWVAVSWHRFILLEEYTDWLPAVSGRPIWSYVGKSILLGLLMLVVILPIFLVFGGLIGASFTESAAETGSMTAEPLRPLFGATVITNLLAIPISYVGLRWGVALVGTALGKPMGFSEAWAKTKPVSMVVLGISVLLMAVNLVMNLVLVVLYPIPVIPDILSIGVSWLTMMLGISILTTLYGHVVEGRPLVTG